MEGPPAGGGGSPSNIHGRGAGTWPESRGMQGSVYSQETVGRYSESMTLRKDGEWGTGVEVGRSVGRPWGSREGGLSWGWRWKRDNRGGMSNAAVGWIERL